MQSASISRRRPTRLLRRYTITAMVKINPAITLLSELCNFRLPRIPSNPCGLIGMLIVDESVALVDNRLKILQRQSVLQILKARSTPAFLSSDARTTFLFQNASPAFFNNARFPSNARPSSVSLKREARVLHVSKRDSCVSNSKRETPVLSASGRDYRVSNSTRETRVSRLTQPTLEVRVSTKKCETRVQNDMSSRHKEPKSPHPYGFKASSSDVPATDLRDYLTRKRSVY